MYAGRSGLDVLFFERESIGGDLVNRHKIRSYPGFPDGISGTELRSKLVAAAEQYESEVNLEAVESIEPGSPHEVQAASGTYEASAVILATGGREASLGVPGEEEYEGRGIFHCAACDGPLYRDERIAVVGGRNHALIDAVFLTKHASEVVMIDSNPELPADGTIVEEVSSHPDIELRTGTTVTEILGSDGLVDGVEVVDNDGDTEAIELSGVNVNVGIVPNTEFVAETVERNEDGQVVVDDRLETSVSGIFSAGDIRSGSPTEIAAATGDGVTALSAAKEYIVESADPR